MCRGIQENESESLKIKSFYAKLSVSSAKTLPDFLTLHYLPRINGSFLEINGSNIRPDSPAFVTLHRVLSADLAYGSRERAVVREGARFEIYAGDVKALKGIFRKDEDDDSWKMDCKCVGDGVEVEVAVEAEGQVGVSVEIAAARRGRRRERRCELEEIPEEREVEREGEAGSGVCRCSECGGEEEMECEMECEGVQWAVDVGIWVVCFGVGYLVSRASPFKTHRRRKVLM